MTFAEALMQPSSTIWKYVLGVIDDIFLSFTQKTLRANDKYTLSAACKCARRLVMSDSWRHVFLRSTAALIDLLASTGEIISAFHSLHYQGRA